MPIERPREANFRDEDQGRLVLACVRIVCNNQDYVAHRLILGLLDGVGTGTCDRIGTVATASNLNFRELFYKALPEGIFDGRSRGALLRAQEVCEEIAAWAPSDTIRDRRSELSRLIGAVLGEEPSAWEEYCGDLPELMSLEELRGLLVVDKADQQRDFLVDVYRRLGESFPEQAFPSRVRIMSMHGAKGLSARIVLIPGLEEEILPGPFRRPYAGLVLEAARMLYVSITRARLACIITYSTRRFTNGRVQPHTPSRFTSSLNCTFRVQPGGLSSEAAQALARDAAHL